MIERYQQQYHGLGSTITLTLITKRENASAEQLFDSLHKHIITFEHRFSRFLKDSELTMFNHAAGQKTSISPAFKRLLNACKQLAVDTNGLFNPFILPALQQAGYVSSWPKVDDVPAPETDYRDRHVAQPDMLLIGDTWAQIPEGTALDFGGIGKGYLLDELSDVLEDEGLTGYWLSLGGDIVCAGYDLEHQEWQVGLEKARNEGEVVATITNKTGSKLAIATSGITKRRGEQWHHIIDPRTGMPAVTNILTATVTSTAAVRADIYAKCCVIGGEETARLLYTQGSINDFYLQTDDTKGYATIGAD